MAFPGAARIQIDQSTRAAKIYTTRNRPIYSRSYSQRINSDADSVEIAFGTALPDANYVVQISFFNSADSVMEKQFLQGLVTQKTANGFTVLLSTVVNTNNHWMEWSIAEKYNP